MIHQAMYLALLQIWSSRKTYQIPVSCGSKCFVVTQNGLYFSTFFMFGMSVGMVGPTLMDFLATYFSDYDIINAFSWLLFTQSALRFVGAIAAGYSIDR